MLKVLLCSLITCIGMAQPVTQEDENGVFEEVFADKNRVKLGQRFKATQDSSWELLDKNKEVVSALKIDRILANQDKATGVIFTLESPIGGTKRTVTGYMDADVVPDRFTYEFFTQSQKLFLLLDAEEGIKDSLNCVFTSDWSR